MGNTSNLTICVGIDTALAIKKRKDIKVSKICDKALRKELGLWKA